MESGNGARAKAANPGASGLLKKSSPGASLLPPVQGGFEPRAGMPITEWFTASDRPPRPTEAPAPLLTKEDHGGLQNHRARPRRVNRHAARFRNGLSQPRPGSGPGASMRAEARLGARMTKKMKIIQLSVNIDKFTGFFDKLLKCHAPVNYCNQKSCHINLSAAHSDSP